MKKYNVKHCLYGHLHSHSIKDAVQGNVEGIELKLVSADGLDFKILQIKNFLIRVGIGDIEANKKHCH